MNHSIKFILCLILFLGIGENLYAQISKEDALQYRKQIADANDFFKQKEYEKAREEYVKVLIKEPSLVKAEYNLGSTYYELKKFDQAAIHYKKAVALADEKEVKAKANHNLGNAYLKQENYDAAIEAYKNALRLNPSDDKTRYNLAMAKNKLKNKPDKNDPPDLPKPSDFAKLQKQKADVLANLGKFDEAYQLLDKAIKRDSTIAHYQTYISKLQEIAILDTIN